MSDAYPKIKRVTTEVAAHTLSQFSPLDLYHTETRAIIDGSYHYPGNISQEDKERIRHGATEYDKRLKRLRQEFGGRAMLYIMIDRSTDILANGKYVNSSFARLSGSPEKEGFRNSFAKNHITDYSIENWELSPDGSASRGWGFGPPSQEPKEISIWEMSDVEDVFIENYVEVAGSGLYSYGYSFAEKLSAHKEGDGFSLAYASHGPTDAIYLPFYDAFTNAPER